MDIQEELAPMQSSPGLTPSKKRARLDHRLSRRIDSGTAKRMFVPHT